MNTKNNQRFKDTEIRMQSVMLELMKYMEFEKITVKKICEKAQVINWFKSQGQISDSSY